MKLFREEAVEARRRRLWGEVSVAQPPSLIAWTLVLAAVFLVLSVILIMGKYTRKETVQGFLAPEAGIVQLRSAQTGRISAVHAEEGSMVRAGTPLIEFVSDIAGAGQQPAVEMQIVESERAEASIAARRTATVRGFSDERQRLNEQILAQQRLGAILGSQRQNQAEALEISEADLERLRQLQGNGFAPRAEVDRRRRAVIAERSALADLDLRISQAAATVAELRSQITNIRARQDEALARLDGEAAALAQRRGELDVAKGHVLRSPIAGTISSVQARVGQTPPADMPLVAISPLGSDLEAHLLVPTRAIGFLKVGQTARLQIEAFPFQRFGFVEGRIKSISRTVLRPGDVAFPIEQNEPVYEIRVSIANSTLTAYGETLSLRAGMTLRADIPIDRRRLWEQLFEPLLASTKRSTS